MYIYIYIYIYIYVYIYIYIYIYIYVCVYAPAGMLSVFPPGLTQRVTPRWGADGLLPG